MSILGNSRLNTYVKVCAVLGAMALGVSALSKPAHADELNIYFFASPGLDWSSPRELTDSVVKSYTSIPKHPIGHVAIEYVCDADANSAQIHGYAAMNMQDPLQPVDFLFVKEYGLGLTVYNMKGRIETADDIEGYKTYHQTHTGMARVQYLISHSTCQRVHEFHQEYAASGTWINYGLPDRPRYGEGAGCSAMGEAFLEIAGIMTPDMKAAWSRTIRVPNALIGTDTVKVSLVKLLEHTPLTDSWATGDEPAFSLFFYDPDLMYHWAQTIYDSLLVAPAEGMGTLSEGASFGITLDRRNVATPTEPLFFTKLN